MYLDMEYRQRLQQLFNGIGQVTRRRGKRQYRTDQHQCDDPYRYEYGIMDTALCNADNAPFPQHIARTVEQIDNARENHDQQNNLHAFEVHRQRNPRQQYHQQ